MKNNDYYNIDRLIPGIYYSEAYNGNFDRIEASVSKLVLLGYTFNGCHKDWFIEIENRRPGGQSDRGFLNIITGEIVLNIHRVLGIYENFTIVQFKDTDKNYKNKNGVYCRNCTGNLLELSYGDISYKVYEGKLMVITDRLSRVGSLNIINDSGQIFNFSKHIKEKDIRKINGIRKQVEGVYEIYGASNNKMLEFNYKLTDIKHYNSR